MAQRRLQQQQQQQQLLQQQQQQQQHQSRVTSGPNTSAAAAGHASRAKAGFQISTPSEENADDEDEWVSSESGAATPNKEDSDSEETASESSGGPPTATNHTSTQLSAQAFQLAQAQNLARQQQQAQLKQLQQQFQLQQLQQQQQQAPPSAQANRDSRTEQPQPHHHLPRTETARQGDFKVLQQPSKFDQISSTPRPKSPLAAPQQAAMTLQQQQYHQQQQQHHQQAQQQHQRSDSTDAQHQSRRESRPSRYSRPPSTHSIRTDHSHNSHQLRPHPLIRGQSYGHLNPSTTQPNLKPAPLAPLTVIPTSAALPEISTSPPSSSHDSVRHYLSSSPTSQKTSSGSPVSAEMPYSAGPGRRTSISSARSVNTIPVHSTIIREPASRAHDRTRTLSTMSSASSSSAALSSLAHLPSLTRPPSPQAVISVSFFPPVNPHANIEGIHPLLPNPYLCNHLTVLARRTPIRESFDRVTRAKFSR